MSKEKYYVWYLYNNFDGEWTYHCFDTLEEVKDFMRSDHYMSEYEYMIFKGKPMV
jgi:hypothetical protein